MTATAQLRDEPAMIAAILGGDGRLFHDLIRPYERSVYMMALSFLKNDEDAEDAAQEAFLKAYRNLSSFRGDAKFGTWLISITLNEARSRLRKAKQMPSESLDEPVDEGGKVSPAVLRDWREVPSEALERKEIHHMMQVAVDALPLIYREVFQLRDVEELSILETAELLNISVPAVKVRLHRARLMLQKTLAPQLQRAHAAPEKKRGWFPWS